MQAYLNQFHALLVAHFSLEEISQLCFTLGINREELAGQTISAVARDLITYMRRHHQLSRLLQAAREARPQITWPELPEITPRLPNYSITQLSLTNPFGLTGCIKTSDFYLVRDPLTEEILHELYKGVSISIVGDSQTGKSSLLWHIHQQGTRLLPAFHHFIYVSLELIHNDEDFFDYIHEELGLPRRRAFRLAQTLQGQRVLLCLDEIEKMAWDGFSLNVRSALRALADGGDAPFTLLIASRSPIQMLFPDMPVMTSPLAGLFTQLKMPAFSWREAKALVHQYCGRLDVTLPEIEVERAWQQTQGHPRRFQQALKEVFARNFL